MPCPFVQCLRPSPENKQPKRFHCSQVSHKNRCREPNVSGVTGVGGIHCIFAYFAIQAAVRYPYATAPHRSLRSLRSLRSRLLFLLVIFWREPYFATSVVRVSRMTVTLISPENCRRSLSELTMFRQIWAADSSVVRFEETSTRISRPACTA